MYLWHAWTLCNQKLLRSSIHRRRQIREEAWVDPEPGACPSRIWWLRGWSFRRFASPLFVGRNSGWAAEPRTLNWDSDDLWWLLTLGGGKLLLASKITSKKKKRQSENYPSTCYHPHFPPFPSMFQKIWVLLLTWSHIMFTVLFFYGENSSWCIDILCYGKC